jgi:hypothetical protein
MEKYLYWFAYRELYVPYETMIERMVWSNFDSRNVHRVEDHNSNPYRNMVMYVMRMN